MDRREEGLFASIGLGFSALLLVLALLCSIQATAVNDRAAALERETAALRLENERLRARCEERLSLAEIERYAVEELGMQYLSADQIVLVPAEK